MTRLRIEGLVDRPLDLGFEEVGALPLQVADVGALVPGKKGAAVRLRALLDAAGIHPTAAWGTLRSADDGFAIAVPLAAVADAALIVYRLGQEPLPRGQGGPFRFLIIDATACGQAGIDTCANVKDLGAIRLTATREPDVGHTH